MALWWLLAGFGVLLGLHLTRSRFRRRVISSARFFKDLPPPRKSSPKLSLNNPLKIPAFYLRLLLLAALIFAVWAMDRKVALTDGGRFHVWYVVDTSSSMTTQTETGTYWDLAKAALFETHAQIQQSPQSSGRFRLSLLDMALRDAGQGKLEDGLAGMVAQEAPRTLGTDLGLLRRELSQSMAVAQKDPITHVVIISDRPAPAWLAQISEVAMLWRDISQPRINLGIDYISPVRNPLTGGVHTVQVLLAAYGIARPDLRLTVIKPGSPESESTPVVWRSDHRGSVELQTNRPGIYRLALTAGGDYQGDDQAVFEIPRGNGVRVDWQLPDRTLPQQLGWEITQENPRIRVGQGQPEDRLRPYLWIGEGLVEGSSEIRDFVEDSPLLADLHFDVVEQFKPTTSKLAPSLRIHLRDTREGIWTATGQNPTSAYIPGLPDGADSPQNRILTTLFFNAVRWLLEESDPQPIFTLTSPLAPEPDGIRLNLHPGEGDTSGIPQSFGSLESLVDPAGMGAEEPWWPRLLLLGAVLFLIERALSLWGGRRWH